MEKSIVCPQVPYLAGEQDLPEDYGNASGGCAALQRKEGGGCDGVGKGRAEIASQNQGSYAPFAG